MSRVRDPSPAPDPASCSAGYSARDRRTRRWSASVVSAGTGAGARARGYGAGITGGSPGRSTAPGRPVRVPSSEESGAPGAEPGATPMMGGHSSSGTAWRTGKRPGRQGLANRGVGDPTRRNGPRTPLADRLLGSPVRSAQGANAAQKAAMSPLRPLSGTKAKLRGGLRKSVRPTEWNRVPSGSAMSATVPEVTCLRRSPELS